MNNETELNRIHEIANDMAALKDRITTTEHLAIYGYLAGTLYSLNKVIKAGYRHYDVETESDVREQSSIVSQVFRLSLSENESDIESRWRSGFYMNCAIHRLSSIGKEMERSGKSGVDFPRPIHRRAEILSGGLIEGFDQYRHMSLYEILEVTSDLCLWFKSCLESLDNQSKL